jgi:hypothetical protein
MMQETASFSLPAPCSIPTRRTTTSTSTKPWMTTSIFTSTSAELYRRKLDQELKGVNDITEVKEVYQKVVNEMTSEHHLFVKEAFGGFNTKALEEWKKKVIVR